MWKKYGIIVLLILGIYLAFRYLLPLVLPFLIAGLVSIVYYPFLRRIYGNTGLWNGRGRRVLLAFSLVFFYGGSFLMLALLCGSIVGQGQSILLNLPFYQARALCFVKGCCGRVDVWLQMADGDSFAYLKRTTQALLGNSLTAMMPRVTSISVQVAGRLFQWIFQIMITVIATFFMIQDYEGIRSNLLGSELGMGFCRVVTKLRATMGTYLRAQGLIMLLDGLLCTAAFFIAGQPYYLTLGSFVALVDALPVLGAGAVLIPYGIILLLYGEMGKAAILFAAYGGCVLIRQITEPRMMGNRIGVRPLYTIAGMYVGFKLFGVFGFLLGPIAMLVGKEVYREVGMLETR